MTNSDEIEREWNSRMNGLPITNKEMKGEPVTKSLIDHAKKLQAEGNLTPDAEAMIKRFTSPLTYPFSNELMELPMTQSTETLVQERGKTHGKFDDHARITQKLKAVVMAELELRRSRGQDSLTATQLESIAMILHKIGRIIAGDANFADHWDDIAGYAKIANGQP